MADYYVEKAKECLKDRKLAIYCIVASQIRDEVGVDYNRSKENQASPEVRANTAKCHEKYWRPMLEKALKGIFPTDKELGEIPDWLNYGPRYSYPLCGYICHVMINADSALYYAAMEIYEVDDKSYGFTPTRLRLKEVTDEDWRRDITNYIARKAEEAKNEFEKPG